MSILREEESSKDATVQRVLQECQILPT